jgi:hypothetical protein
MASHFYQFIDGVSANERHLYAKNIVLSLGLLLMIMVAIFSPLPTIADKLTDTIIVSDDWNNQVLKDRFIDKKINH